MNSEDKKKQKKLDQLDDECKRIGTIIDYLQKQINTRRERSNKKYMERYELTRDKNIQNNE